MYYVKIISPRNTMYKLVNEKLIKGIGILIILIVMFSFITLGHLIYTRIVKIDIKIK